MRSRERIVASLESTYREAFERAEKEEDSEGMTRLDFEFQRDQVLLEVLLDVRAALTAAPPDPEQKGTSLLEKAQTLRKLKNFTKLR